MTSFKNTITILPILLALEVRGQISSFKTCLPLQNILQFMDGRFVQYYEADLRYDGGLRAIKKAVAERYRPGVDTLGQSGYLTIRFIVNCHGQTGNFEVLEVDDAFKEFEFNNDIRNLLLEIVADLRGWIPGKNTRGESVDCQKFLTFKLKNGRLVAVLPK